MQNGSFRTNVDIHEKESERAILFWFENKLKQKSKSSLRLIGINSKQ